jgi:hypothetical protein
MIPNLTILAAGQRVAEAPASHGSPPHSRAKQIRQRAGAMLVHLLSASDTICCRRAAFPSLEPHPFRGVNQVSDFDRRSVRVLSPDTNQED